MTPFLTVDEVRAMCNPLKRSSAIYDWCVNEYKLRPVGRMPCGLPLIPRAQFDGQDVVKSSFNQPDSESFLRLVTDRSKKT